VNHPERIGPDVAPGTRVAGRFGVARADVTPPAGIFFRNWGAGTRDVAAGVHRPFTATALTIRSSPDEPPFVLIALDAGWWQAGADEAFVRSGVLEALDLGEERVMINLSHTHAGPPLVSENSGRPGGEFVGPYLASLRTAIADVARRALEGEIEGELRWAQGRCDLATNRSRWDPQGDRYVTGYEPANPADDTVLVGRITRADGEVVGTLVNYACHPTTLAWDNVLLSPDYIGAMRETVEAGTGDAPCLFLFGAAGELAPDLQYVGDVAVADRHGRRLGLAALSTLHGMHPHGHELVFDRIVESGAPLAVWRLDARPAERGLVAGERIELALPIKPDYPALDEIEGELARATEPFMRERWTRKLRLRQTLGDADHYALAVWVWRLGDVVFVGYPGEAFSQLQLDLRAAFPGRTVVVMNVVNGSIGYLPPAELYDEDMYEVWQTPLDRGCLEALRDASIDAAGGLLARGRPDHREGTPHP
jgi:hypothetical protein